MAYGDTPTDRELEILKILWDRGDSTVREVYEIMRSREDIAQNTVQTFLRLMEDKKLVCHAVRGRAFVYQPLYTRQRILSRFVTSIFDGAVGELVQQALRIKKLSVREIEEIEAMIRQSRRA